LRDRCSDCCCDRNRALPVRDALHRRRARVHLVLPAHARQVFVPVLLRRHPARHRRALPYLLCGGRPDYCTKQHPDPDIDRHPDRGAGRVRSDGCDQIRLLAPEADRGGTQRCPRWGDNRAITAETRGGMKHTAPPAVVMFAMGGTIASTSVEGRAGADVSLSGEELMHALPGLDSIASVTVRSFRKVPSGDLTMEDVLQLAAEIRSEVESGTGGVVVTQGTDTLEEVAYALDLLLHLDAPVVVTGAMRNSSLPGSDGPANMLAAIKVASSEDARGMGALVVFDDEIHAARFLRKRHTTSPATFGSPLVGPLGLVTEDRVSIFLRPRGRMHIKVRAEAPDAKI